MIPRSDQGLAIGVGNISASDRMHSNAIFLPGPVKLSPLCHSFAKEHSPAHVRQILRKSQAIQSLYPAFFFSCDGLGLLRLTNTPVGATKLDQQVSPV